MMDDNTPINTNNSSNTELDSKQNLVLQELEKITQNINNIYSLVAKLSKKIDFLEKISEKIKNSADMSKHNAQESNWATIFFDTIKNCKWLNSVAFPAGRWAVGYAYLYVAYQSLTNMHPKNILELGLGVSSLLFSNYANTFNANHLIIEHNKEWISFFQQNNTLYNATQIINTTINENTNFMDEKNIIAYDNFTDILGSELFDFISIDGPYGSKKNYSRIDILSIIPQRLANSFVIMFDDTQRLGETNTLKQLKDILTKNNIEYKEGTYKGIKDTTILTSLDNSFLCSL